MKYTKNILGSFLTTLTLFAIVLSPVFAATEIVSDNTSAGQDLPGWLFNRDTRTSTAYEFNYDHAVVGSGSLYVPPIQNTNYTGFPGNDPNWDKFVGENFTNTTIANINSISYDYRIDSSGEEADKVHFYMSVYANFGESNDNKFYDCRYSVVPTVGSTAGFTTVTFDPTQSYPVTTRTGDEASPHTCPAVPAQMDNLSPGSNMRVFALNVGDTSGNDTGVGGYIDNVVVNLDSGTTVYDLDPRQPTGVITYPVADGDHVMGSVNFTATYDDGDESNDDAVQWAIREGASCSTGTVAGNVDTFSDSSSWNGSAFSATLDTFSWTPGEYCFVFNPTDDAGENDVRVTRTFFVDADPYALPAACAATGYTYGAPIIGTNGTDKINGTSGNDLIFALGGSDKVDGKGGHDCIVGGDGSDKLSGGTGNDVILGGDNSDSIKGDGGNDYLYGENDSDTLSGGTGDDHLYGGSGSDSLKGDSNNDVLDGEDGTDAAKGGSGTDACTAESIKQCEA